MDLQDISSESMDYSINEKICRGSGKAPDELQKLIGELEVDLGHEINYTLLPKEEFLYRKQVSDRFLASILGSEKVVMVNRLGV